jgi:hypothetical protein
VIVPDEEPTTMPNITRTGENHPSKYHVKFEDLVAATMKTTVF